MEPIQNPPSPPLPPAVVLALANKVGLTPLAWRVEPQSVVIVFVEGPKLIFDKEPQAEGAPKPAPKRRKD